MANKIPLVVADFETQLATSLAVGGTTFTLASATDDDGNSLPAGKYCFTIDNGKSTKEYLMGQLNGTSVTSAVSVDRQGGETSGALQVHRIGAPVVITDFATIQRVADILAGQETLDGDNPPVFDAEPTLGADRKALATVGFVLDTASGTTDLAFESQTVAGTGGEDISAGELVYFKTSDQEWYLTDATDSATVEGVQLGIAMGTGSNGVSITGGVLVNGIYTTSGLTAGSEYYASNTAGAYATSSGTNSRKIGIALSTTKLFFYAANPQTVTNDEKDALAGGGDLDTPSSTNKFLTEATRKVPLIAGESITGATLPVPVYQNKTDNEFYICDGNDSGKTGFLGFAVSNGSDGGQVHVQFQGIVAGFSGLLEGEKYYLSDTAGQISTTIGTYEVLVGIAITETQLLVCRGRRGMKGSFTAVDSGSSGSTQDFVITSGFKPSVVRVWGEYNDPESAASGTDEMRPSTVAIWRNGSVSQVGGNVPYAVSLPSVTDTGFTIRITQTNSSPDSMSAVWEAEGEV